AHELRAVPEPPTSAHGGLLRGDRALAGADGRKAPGAAGAFGQRDRAAAAGERRGPPARVCLRWRAGHAPAGGWLGAGHGPGRGLAALPGRVSRRAVSPRPGQPGVAGALLTSALRLPGLRRSDPAAMSRRVATRRAPPACWAL